ncbi:MAG: hypothetical protein ACI9QV_000726 [Methylophagaceae bacterium]|jgi:hypothetical protein
MTKREMRSFKKQPDSTINDLTVYAVVYETKKQNINFDLNIVLNNDWSPTAKTSKGWQQCGLLVKAFDIEIITLEFGYMINSTQLDYTRDTIQRGICEAVALRK